MLLLPLLLLLLLPLLLLLLLLLLLKLLLLMLLPLLQLLLLMLLLLLLLQLTTGNGGCCFDACLLPTPMPIPMPTTMPRPIPMPESVDGGVNGVLLGTKLMLEIAGGNGDLCESLPISPVYLVSKRIAIISIDSLRNPRQNSLYIGVLPANLQALLLGTLAGDQGLDVVLHRIVHELVLRLSLHETGTLRSDHLDGALNVDFGIQSCGETSKESGFN